MRIGESRLGKAILDLCGAPHPRLPVLQALSLITDTMIEARITASLAPSSSTLMSSTSVPKGQGSKRQNQFVRSPQELQSTAMKLMKNVGLPTDVYKALSPFVKILSTPQYYDPPSALSFEVNCGALNMLQHIEKAFYEHEIITAMRCQVSKAVKEKELLRSTSSSNSAASIAGTTGKGYSRKELRRYRMLLQEFDEAVINLKITLGIFYKALGHQILQQKSTCPQQQRGQGGVANSHPGIAFQQNSKQTKSSSDSLSVNAIPLSSVESCYQYAFLDLGIEVYQDLSVYGSGLYFQVEAVVVTTQNGPGGSGKGGKHQQLHTSQRGNMIEVVHHLLAHGGHFENLLRRFKHPSFSQVQGSTASRPHGTNSGSGISSSTSMGNLSAIQMTSHVPSVIAVGMRASVSRLQEFIISALAAKNPLNIHLFLPSSDTQAISKESSSSSAKTPCDKGVPSVPCAALMSNLASPKVLVVDYESFENNGELASSNGTHSSYEDITVVLDTLRQSGDILSSDSLHQLHTGMVGPGAVTTSTTSSSAVKGGPNQSTLAAASSSSLLSMVKDRDVDKPKLNDLCALYQVPFLVALAPAAKGSNIPTRQHDNKIGGSMCKVRMIVNEQCDDLTTVTPSSPLSVKSSSPEHGADVWVPLDQLVHFVKNSGGRSTAAGGSFVYDHSRAGYVYSFDGKYSSKGIAGGGVSLLGGSGTQSHGNSDSLPPTAPQQPHQQTNNSINSNSSHSNSMGNQPASMDSSTVSPSWRKNFVVVERSSTPKDKKMREKEHSRWKQRVDKYMLEVLGLNPAALAAEKHVPVVCISEIPFKVIREMANLVSDNTLMMNTGGSQGHTNKREKNSTNNLLMAFVADQQQVSYRRGLKALLIELCETNAVINSSSGGSANSHNSGSGNSSSGNDHSQNATSPDQVLQHVLLYSTAEDRYLMLSYTPSALLKLIN